MDQLSSIILNGKFELQEAGFATVDSFWSQIVWFYQHNRLYLVTGGEARMKFSNTEYNLQKDMLYFIPEKSILSGSCDTLMSHYYVHFHIDPYLNNLLKLIIKPQVPNKLPVNEEAFKILVDNLPPKDSLAEKKNCTASRVACDGALKLLLSNFFQDTASFNPNTLRFVDTLSYINNNLHKRITVGELAERASLNEVYFSNSFKKSFGITLQEYIISQKIEHACLLLTDHRHSIKEIAFMLGFIDESHFSRSFKKKCGISPKSFRATAG